MTRFILRRAMQDGRLEAIFRKWQLWNEDQPRLYARLLADGNEGDDAKPVEAAEAAIEPVPENATDVLPPIDPQTMAHFVAVQSALTPEEAAVAREVAKELSATELRAWFDDLSALSVPDAVAKVQKLISGFGKDGGAS